MITKKKLIMVMGVQRSGTTALFNSIARDQNVTALNESVDNDIYDKYRLRPVEQIAPILTAAPGTVLLKPLSETFDRSIEMVRSEFEPYDVKFVWIYRDPVNVIFSMYQKGWLRQSDVDRTVHVEEWIRRNRLALAFQEKNRTEIALVRYEDCSADPAVFQTLCDWLQVTGEPFFRPDRGQGRRQMSAQAQQNIDAATGPILGALNTARTFRPRGFRHWRRALATSLTRSPRKWNQPSLSSVETSWHPDRSLVPAAIPSSIDNLHCWIDAGQKPRGNDRLADFAESGPHKLPAGTDSNPPFHIPFLNGKHALYFPFEKAADRKKGPSGIVSFGDACDWRFVFDGAPYSAFALFKPAFPRRAICEQERAVVLCVGHSAGAPGFTMSWNRNLRATQIIVRPAGSEVPVVASTAAGSHPNHQWRVVHFQFGGGDNSQISISSNGFPGTPASFLPDPRTASQIEFLPLQLGGDGEPGALFYGGFAELIVFKRALKTSEQLGILSYLRKKYGL